MLIIDQKTFKIDLGVVWGGFWEAKRDQKWIKNDIENRYGFFIDF